MKYIIKILYQILFILLLGASPIKAKQTSAALIAGDLAKLGLMQFTTEVDYLLSEKMGFSMYCGNGIVSGEKVNVWVLGSGAYCDWFIPTSGQTKQSVCEQFLRRMDNYADDMSLGRERGDIIYRTFDKTWGDRKRLYALRELQECLKKYKSKLQVSRTELYDQQKTRRRQKPKNRGGRKAGKTPEGGFYHFCCFVLLSVRGRFINSVRNMYTAVFIMFNMCGRNVSISFFKNWEITSLDRSSYLVWVFGKVIKPTLGYF